YQAVTSLRRVLGDDPKQPTYIATVPRLGYRMVATVSPWADRAKDGAVEDQAIPRTNASRASDGEPTALAPTDPPIRDTLAPGSRLGTGRKLPAGGAG